MNREMLHSYFDGELSPSDRAAVEAWLASDPEAAREFEALRAIDGALDGWSVDPAALAGDASFYESVRAATAAPAPVRGRLLRIAVPLAAAAAVLVAVALRLGGGTDDGNGGSVLDTRDYMQYVWEADAETYGSLALDDLESQILAELDAT